MGVSKLVCSHLQLRHLMLLRQTEEPEVYPLSTAILEAEKSLLDQSDRSTQIVLSTGPICLGLCTFVLLTPHDGDGYNVNSFLPQERLILKGSFKIQSKVIQGHKKY